MPDVMMSKKEAYKLLGVSSIATDKEIRRAHRILSAANHPDRNPEDKDLYNKLRTAFETLIPPVTQPYLDENGERITSTTTAPQSNNGTPGDYWNSSKGTGFGEDFKQATAGKRDQQKLHYAAINNYPDEARALLMKGTPIDSVTAGDVIGLNLTGIMNIFITHGYTPTSQMFDVVTDLALRNRKYEPMLNEMLKANNLAPSEYALGLAIDHGRDDLVDHFVFNNAQVTPLLIRKAVHWIAAAGPAGNLSYEAMLNSLLEGGKGIPDSNTIVYAADQGRADISRKLAEYAVKNRGNTAAGPGFSTIKNYFGFGKPGC